MVSNNSIAISFEKGIQILRFVLRTFYRNCWQNRKKFFHGRCIKKKGSVYYVNLSESSKERALATSIFGSNISELLLICDVGRYSCVLWPTLRRILRIDDLRNFFSKNNFSSFRIFLPSTFWALIKEIFLALRKIVIAEFAMGEEGKKLIFFYTTISIVKLR